MASPQHLKNYALIVTGHAGPLGPRPGLLQALADHHKNLSDPLFKYAAFVSNEIYHFVVPFDSPADLRDWPSNADELRKTASGAALNKELDASFAAVDTQIIAFRDEYSNWPAGEALPGELVAITVSVNHGKWAEFHAAAAKTVSEMKSKSGRRWIVYSNLTGDVSKFHILVDAGGEPWWDNARQFPDLLANVNHTVEKRLTHKPEISTLN